MFWFFPPEGDSIELIDNWCAVTDALTKFQSPAADNLVPVDEVQPGDPIAVNLIANAPIDKVRNGNRRVGHAMWDNCT